MRSNRQIKKFSKQAMEILIRGFGYKRGDFTLEGSQGYRKQWPLVWMHWSTPCYWYGESDELEATTVLWEMVFDSLAVYSESPEIAWPNGRPKQGIRRLIAQARQLVAEKGGA